MDLESFLALDDARFIVSFSKSDNPRTKVVIRDEHEEIFRYIARAVRNNYDFWKVADDIDREHHPECEDYYNLTREEQRDHKDHEEIEKRVDDIRCDLFTLIDDIPDAEGYIEAGWLIEIDCPY